MADNYNPNNGAPNNYGYQNNNYQNNGYQNNGYNNYPQYEPGKGQAIASMVLGIVGIVFWWFGYYWYYFSGNVKGSRILRRYQNSGFCAFVDLCYSRSYYFLCLRYRLCWYRLRRGVQLNIVQYIFKPPVLKDNTYKSGVFLLSIS